MENLDRKRHWENIYENRQPDEVSWYQPKPTLSLDFLKLAKLPKTASIIDTGGGESLFVDYLLDAGYKNITVLDISDTAIRHARQRVGDKANLVKWIVSDVVDFEPEEKYDFWRRSLRRFTIRKPPITATVKAPARRIATMTFMVYRPLVGS